MSLGHSYLCMYKMLFTLSCMFAGITAFKAQDYQKALKLYTEAIELSFGSPQSHEFYAKRAEVYYELRESEEMLQDANECIARKFDWPWVRLCTYWYLLYVDDFGLMLNCFTLQINSWNL